MENAGAGRSVTRTRKRGQTTDMQGKWGGADLPRRGHPSSVTQAGTTSQLQKCSRDPCDTGGMNTTRTLNKGQRTTEAPRLYVSVCLLQMTYALWPTHNPALSASEKITAGHWLQNHLRVYKEAYLTHKVSKSTTHIQ